MKSRKPISDRAKLIGAAIFLLLFFAAAVFFWSLWLKWYLSVPFAVLTLCAIEFFSRWGRMMYLLKRPCCPPIPDFILNRLQKTIPTPVTIENTNLLTSISEWLVNDFMQCAFYGNFSSIGQGTPEEVQKAYGNLIAQYQAAKKDEHMKEYVKLMGQIKAIEAKWKLIETIAGIMKERYSRTGAEALRNHYPLYDFSETSFAQDLEMVAKSEISNQRKYDRLCAALKKMDAENKPESKLTPEQKEANFLDRVADINKHEGSRYKPDETTMMEFAVLENRLERYIEQLKQDIKK